MSAVLLSLHALAGIIVLAEALNKLERCRPLAPSLSLHDRAVDSLKALAWLLLALGAGGAVAGPLLRMAHPTLNQAAVLIGFAILIIRTRVKEG